MKKIKLPLTDDVIKELKAGDSVLITGSMITGRDAAHKRLFELIEKGEKLPVNIEGEVIYYVGPAPAKPGHAVGPAVYFAAIGGAAALISRSIKKAEVLAYEDLGTEAIYRFEVEDFPAIVAIDSNGNSVLAK